MSKRCNPVSKGAWRRNIPRTPAAVLAYACVCMFSAIADAGEITYDAVVAKGGVGAIANGVSVAVDSDTNRLMLGPVGSKRCKGLMALPGCYREWVGSDAGTTQIVLTDGVHVSDQSVLLNGAYPSSATSNRIDLAKLIIVMFYPTEIRYVNMRTNTAGKFRRE